MDMCRLRYVGEAPVAVPVLGREVDPDCIVDFAGRVLTDPKELKERGLAEPADDCFLVEVGNPPQVRAFPTSLWRNETPTVPAKKSKE